MRPSRAQRDLTSTDTNSPKDRGMAKKQKIAIGVDIGGSGIKAAPVDLSTGEFLDKRQRIATPQPATPESMGAVVRELVESYDYPLTTPVGVVLPSLVRDGVVMTAANIDDSWVGCHVVEMFSELLGREVTVANDADAAGYAEAMYGKGITRGGVTFFATLGTGIGSALIVDGTLVPNTELGHLEIDGFNAETRAASSAKDREGLSWEEWAARLQRYFEVIEFLFSPDRIIVGGGVSKDHEEFLPLLNLHAPITPATLLNKAGIIGAAALAGHGRSLASLEKIYD